MIRVVRLLLSGSMLVILAAGNAQAGVILALQFSDASLSKTVNSGDSVYVDLLIGDTDVNGPLVTEGLLSGGGRLVRSSGSIILTAGTITGNPGWIEAFDTNPPSSGTGVEIAKAVGITNLLGPPVFPTLPLTGPPYTVRIATFELTAVGAAGSTATITADILGAGFDGNVTFENLTVLDPDILSFGSVDLTISSAAAVPEPATMLPWSLTAAIAGGVAWRRRKNVLATTTRTA